MSNYINIGIIKTTEFIDKLEILAKSVDEKNIIRHNGGEYNEKEYLKLLVTEARELLKCNEWLVALENTLDNLCEVDYKLEDELINLVAIAFETSIEKSDRTKLIQFLNKG